MMTAERETRNLIFLWDKRAAESTKGGKGFFALQSLLSLFLYFTVFWLPHVRIKDVNAHFLAIAH